MGKYKQYLLNKYDTDDIEDVLEMENIPTEDEAPTIPDDVYKDAQLAGISTEDLLHEVTKRGFVIDWDTTNLIQVTANLSAMKEILDDKIKDMP